MLLLRINETTIPVRDNVLHFQFDVENVDVASFVYPDSLALLLNKEGKLISDNHIVFYNSLFVKEYEYPEWHLNVPEQIRIPIYDKRPCDQDYSVFGERNTDRFSVHFDNIREDVHKIEFIIYSDKEYRFNSLSFVLSDCRTEFSKYYKYSDTYIQCTLCACIERDGDDWIINTSLKPLGCDLYDYVNKRSL